MLTNPPHLLATLHILTVLSAPPQDTHHTCVTVLLDALARWTACDNACKLGVNSHSYVPYNLGRKRR